MRPDQMAEAAKAQRPEILLTTDNKTVLLEMGRDGKFSAKSNAWGGQQSHPRGRGVGHQGQRGPAGSSRSGRLRSRWSVPAPLPRPAL